MSVTRSYLVCSGPRTGSTLLCDALKQTGRCGRPREYFLPQGPNLARKFGVKADSEGDFRVYLRDLVECSATPNGVFGTKLMWKQFNLVCDRIAEANQMPRDARPDPEWLSDIFPGVRFLWVRREDVVRQAISMWKAKQTDVYHQWSHRPQEGEATSPTYDFEQIRKIRDRFISYNEHWKHFFDTHGITPREEVYEDFSEDLEGSVRRIMNYLEIESDDLAELGTSSLKRLANDQAERWRTRFLEDEARL